MNKVILDLSVAEDVTKLGSIFHNPRGRIRLRV